jgi:putative transposase
MHILAQSGKAKGWPIVILKKERASLVTNCGRICYKRRKINVSTVFAGQLLGVKQVTNSVWLVSFMHYDLGYFDAETVRLEPIKNPFRSDVLPK